MPQDLVKIDTASWSVLQASPADTLALMKEAAGPQGLRASDLPSVKLPPQGITTWMVETLDGTRTEKELQTVILSFHDKRAYWQHAYGTGGDVMPDCSSDDGRTPSPLAQNPQAKNCLTCKQNVFGTALQGGGKACRERKMLFTLTPTQTIPTILNLPPTSLAAARKYLISLAHLGVRPHQVITGITLSTGKNNVAVAVFRSLGRVPAEQAELVNGYYQFIGDVAKSMTLTREDYEE